MIIFYTLLLVFLPSSQATPAPHRHHNLDTDVDMDLSPRLPYRNRASSRAESEEPSRTSSLRGQWFELPTVPAFYPRIHDDEDDYDWDGGESSGSAGTESLTSTVLSLTEEYDTYEEGPLDGHKDHLVNGSSAVNSLWFVSLIVSLAVAMLLHY